MTAKTDIENHAKPLPIKPSEVLDFMEEMHLDIANNFSAYLQIFCGLHSGIPKCCVGFQMLIRVPLLDLFGDVDTGDIWEEDGPGPQTISEHLAFEAETIDLGYWCWLDTVTKLMGLERWGYYPCPGCIVSRRRVPELARCRCTKRTGILRNAYEKEVAKRLRTQTPVVTS